jgi:uncharacterized membrane protein YedE/YeeE
MLVYYDARSKKTPDPLMAPFDPVSAAIGGALIGLSATLLMLLTGRIAGVAGILGDLVGGAERAWRLAFVLGLIAAPLALSAGGLPLRAPPMPALTVVAVAGLLVGFGTRLGNGCTSGHGICGIARLSPRSIAATMTFMIVAMLVVAISRHAM